MNGDTLILFYVSVSLVLQKMPNCKEETESWTVMVKHPFCCSAGDEW